MSRSAFFTIVPVSYKIKQCPTLTGSDYEESLRYYSRDAFKCKITRAAVTATEPC